MFQARCLGGEITICSRQKESSENRDRSGDSHRNVSGSSLPMLCVTEMLSLFVKWTEFQRLLQVELQTETSVNGTLSMLSPGLCSNVNMSRVALKGQMHHHDDLGSKCAYMCHLSNKTTRKSVLLSTPQIWLMKVSKKLA